jgi:hypothetical protein
LIHSSKQNSPDVRTDHPFKQSTYQIGRMYMKENYTLTRSKSAIQR